MKVKPTQIAASSCTRAVKKLHHLEIDYDQLANDLKQAKEGDLFSVEYYQGRHSNIKKTLESRHLVKDKDYRLTFIANSNDRKVGTYYFESLKPPREKLVYYGKN